MQPHANAMGTGEDRRTQPDAGRRMRGPHDQSALKPATGLMMEVWASVASWFFRPESCITTSARTSTTVRAPTDFCTAIRCTVPSCSCECFTPGKLNIRYCESCNHSWVPHALDKLGGRHSQPCVEPVQPNAAFDIASLVLYGCQALPIRLKILLDRLFSVLRREEVLHVLAGFGWTHDDYARGYILQEAHGATLERWHICSAEEEPLVLRQFLRFGETRAIALQLLAAAAASASPRLLDADVRRPPGRPRRPPTPPHPVAPPVRPPPPPPMSPLQKMNYLKLPTTPTNMSSNSNGSLCSPPGIPVSSPMSVSPLNRLQSMQPFDFRKMNNADLSSRRRLSDTPSDSSPPGLMNLTLSSPCLPPPPAPLAAVSSANCYTSATMSATALMPGVLPPPPLPPPPPPPPVHQNHVSDSKSPAMDMLSGTGSSDFGSEEDDDEENFQSALNLSRDGVGLYKARQRPGHIRKTSTPMKRQWGSGMGDLPLNLGTQLVNPATGKKRVQCNVCLKTFCDKGALKIHFSAVHLREMHKCTVDGCNMMFSSRRSRNRHSANPNPKLHSPHLRRKISPHDGRSAQAHPLLVPPPPPGSLALGPLSFPPFPLLAQPHLPKHSLDLTMHRFDERRMDFSNNTNSSEDIMTYSNHQSDEDDDGFDDDEDGIVVDGGVDEDDNEDKVEEDEQKRLHNGLTETADESDNSAKRPKISESDADDDVASNLDSNDDSLSVVDTNSVKEENGTESAVALTRNARKRKNQNPTRCAVAPMMEAHDSMTDEESSADIYSVPVPPDEGVCNKSPKLENHLENCSPRGKVAEDEMGECRKDLSVKSETGHESTKQEEEKPENRVDVIHSDNENTVKENQDDHVEDNNEKENNKEEQVHENRDNDTEDQLLRSRPREAEQMEDDEDSPNSRSSDVSLSSSHALRRLESLSQGPFGDMGFPGGPPSPARSHGSSSNDSPSDDAHYFFPETGGFIGSMDVPIDKDNPRRCTACGKIFQNHFGVKTHFQNVHLKLMHKCTVEGCNAAFPSKRSRDRHSANLNLHRKLLSTSSSDKSGVGLFMDKSPFASLASNPSLHGEFLARLYAESQSLPLNLEAAFKSLPPLGPPPPGSLAEQFLLNGDRLPPPPHPGLLLPPLGFPGFPSHLLAGINGDRKDDSASMSPPSAKTSQQQGFSVEDDPPSPDRDGRFPCAFCQQPLVDAAALKDHYDARHLMELHRCGACGKMFVSRERRQAHVESAHAATPSALTACS